MTGRPYLIETAALVGAVSFGPCAAAQPLFAPLVAGCTLLAAAGVALRMAVPERASTLVGDDEILNQIPLLTASPERLARR